MNKTYRIRKPSERQLRSSKRGFNKRSTIRVMNNNKSNESIAVAYGNNDLDINLSTAILVLSPNSKTIINENNRKQHVNNKTKTIILSSPTSNANNIEKKRCCSILMDSNCHNNELENNENNEINVENSKIKHKMTLIENTFDNINQKKQCIDEDDGFHSDTQQQQQQRINLFAIKSNAENGFKNQIKHCRNQISQHSDSINCCSCSNTVVDNQNKTENITFNVNMASTPKSVRSRKTIVKQPNGGENNRKADTHHHQQHMVPTIKEEYSCSSSGCSSGETKIAQSSSSSSSSCCCCCCCCCCQPNAYQHRYPPIHIIDPHGYQLMQNIISHKDICENHLLGVKNVITTTTRKYEIIDTNDYASKQTKFKQELRKTKGTKVINEDNLLKKNIVVDATSYDVTCTNVVSCNGYFKKLLKKTKTLKKSVTTAVKEPETKSRAIQTKISKLNKSKRKLKATIKNKIVNLDSINDESSKKHKKISQKLSLFQRKVVKKSETIEQKNELHEQVESGDPTAAAAAAAEIANRTYLHNTFLTDFNQYGQFRIWYV